MNIFKRQIKFTSAICPKCQGNLHLDPKLERAFCQYCGAECIVENAPKKSKRQGNLELVLDFVERQQTLRREEKEKQLALEQEMENRRLEAQRAEEAKKKLHHEKRKEKCKVYLAKFWWIYAISFIVIYTISLLTN